jgi:hypothetical protein
MMRDPRWLRRVDEILIDAWVALVGLIWIVITWIANWPRWIRIACAVGLAVTFALVATTIVAAVWFGGPSL